LFYQLKGRAMADITNKSVVVTITRDEARVWATGMERRMNPTKIFAHLPTFLPTNIHKFFLGFE